MEEMCHFLVVNKRRGDMYVEDVCYSVYIEDRFSAKRKSFQDIYKREKKT